MSRRLLVVNADDYNTDPGRDAGILEAARSGVVTSTSALANLPWETGAARTLREAFGAAVGVHFNLTRGRPLTDGRTLVGPDGQLLSKAEAWDRALAGGYDLGEVEAEAHAQIRRLRELGLELDHIDGNNHIHVFPGFPRAVARAARRAGIDRVRLPAERVPREEEPERGRPTASEADASPRAKRRFLLALCREAAAVFREHGLDFPEHFAGIEAPAPGDVEGLRAFLSDLRPGVTELMVHPGRVHPGNPFSNEERAREEAALSDPRVVAEVASQGVRLTTFSEWGR